ncbi:phosphotransferase family protein [Micromonospora sp. NPDC003197]
MKRAFLQLDDVHDLVADRFGVSRRIVALDRLTGGTKKGVYRLSLDDQTSVILYVWAAGENYWPPSPTVPDDPFTDASGAELFATNHAALAAVDVRIPQLLMLDRDGRYLDADIALLEDVGTVKLDTLMERDLAAAVTPLSMLGDALRRMHTTLGSKHGKLAAPAPAPAFASASGEASQIRRAEDIVVDRALSHLHAVAIRDPRLAEARDRIAEHVRHLRDAITERETYGLVHGELGPDHVLVTPAGEPVVIDNEGLTYFDVEWEHAWLQMRFGDAYPLLRPVDLDPHRMTLYRYAQVLSLIEGPLRIADTDFPDRQWMLDLAERNIDKALTGAMR